jgi:iron complex outermembrane receptor protein
VAPAEWKEIAVLGTRFRWIAIFWIALASLRVSTGAAQEPLDPGSEPDTALPSGIEAPRPIAPPPQNVEAIEVTGERLDATDIQDEAQAVTAFSGADLDRANIVNIDSLQFNVPGLHVGQSGQQAIVTLRGVGTENASITGEPGVAFHVDGVNYAQPSAARVAFFDLESLDIKRGPQGLEGGKNSTSGTINVTTRKPGDEYEFSADYLMGNYDRRRTRGAVNVPINELLAVRTAVFHEDRDGFLDNIGRSDNRDAFDADDFGLRTHVRVVPGDALELLLSYNYFEQGGVGPQSDIAPIPRVHQCGTTLVPSGLPSFAACQGALDDDDPRSSYATPSSQDTRFWGWTANLQWDVAQLPLLGETRLVGITGFQSSEVDFRQDFDGTNLRFLEIPFSTQDVEQHTGELRWTGTLAAERLEWQAGAYIAHERGERELQVDNFLGNIGLGGSFDPQDLSASVTKIDQGTDNDALGASLHGRLHVLENVRFELGGRWIRDEKRMRLFRDAPSPTDNSLRFIGCDGSLSYRVLDDQGRPVEGGMPARASPWCGETYRGRMWGTGLDWRPFGNDHLLYAKLDRGYKSGGWRSGERGTYLPEKIWAYSAGSKSEFFDSRLQLNLEGFFYNYQDMQLVVIDGTSLRTENADTRMYGWDLEAKASPIDGLDLGLVVSFLKTEIGEYLTLEPADLASYNGNPADERLSNGTQASASVIEAFNRVRLNSRDAAENLTDQGTPRSYATSRTCYASLEAVARGFPAATRCGRVTPTGGLDDFSGNELSRAPKWKITLSGGYDVPIGRFGTLTPRVQYTWQDDTYFRAFNRSFDLQEDYHLTDLKLEWHSPEERWDAEVFVQNIEDEAPIQNVLVGPRGFGSPPFAWYGPPRFYGVRVGFKY